AAAMDVDIKKPGVCPKINLEDDMIGVCAELCSQDGHCPNDEKCCSNGCGHQCMAVSKGPGVCPKRFLGVGLCKGLCVNDIDCPKDEKCCSTKCGFKCTPPYKGLVYVSNQMCADNSSHDDPYPARQKCCLTTCACSEPCQFSHREKVLDCSLSFSFFVHAILDLFNSLNLIA
uniref:WAP domain-containing protein n=1 Tax=Sinocyclocheilus grahami TaxID=75366 RepID=A0A672M2R0_SINGR